MKTTITQNSKLKDVKKTPHYRKGYFKMLKNKRFKNNIGSIVFVNECLINGGTLADQAYVDNEIIIL